jgi:hypothetical protein
MKTKIKLHRILQALFIIGFSVFALAPAHAADAPKVTADNYVRAESDIQMKGYIESFKCFGKFHHNRQPYDVDNQITIRGNRDTLYSFGVWDLTSPITITLPDTKGRYQSLMIVSQDHSIWGLYGPKTGTLTEEKVGTRYVLLTIRTFADPNDEQDMKKAHRLQEAVVVNRRILESSKCPIGRRTRWSRCGTRSMWSPPRSRILQNVRQERGAGPGLLDAGRCSRLGRIAGGGSHYMNVFPEKNDGKTPYTLTAKDVPVDAFWSVTLYDDKGWMPVNEYNAYSFNNVTAKKAKDGSITIHFGGDPKADNFLPIVPGWNYIVRLYRPKKEILDGSWTFPNPQVVE